MHFSNFQVVKFLYKKCFANDNNDSRLNEMLYIVKLEVRELCLVKKNLDFTFFVV